MKTLFLSLTYCSKTTKVKRSNNLKRHENDLIIKENIMQLMQENKALWL
ncbi:hypothetical protein [Flavobacterium sp. MDT1-60]|nr:hypothetical protein [Flavobacterium sp. MDT1-60]QOG00703.1 hypothetical protein IHE43_12765 [Flavobacterium sp. MDT1-60]